LCLLIAGAVVLGATYAGWNAGLATARAEAAITADAYVRQQCARIPSDLTAGKLQLAQRRFEELLKRESPPACLIELAPTATAAYLLSAPSPTPPPTMTASPLPPTAAPSEPAAPTSAATLEPISGDGLAGYDLEALLEEARNALSLRDYPSAIDTLEALTSIDAGFQQDLTRRLLLEALTAQALVLYRSGRLSEAIVMTDRAEEYGSIEELNYERFIALLYLDGQRYKVANPAEAVRKFSSMVYEFGVRDYVNGSVATELQEAHRNYALALALQGEHCPAQAQFQAALELQPAYSRVNLGDLAARRDQSALACREQQQGAIATTGAASEGMPQEGGLSAVASPAPVGHSG
jgi:tetratricopeptide (TPR) repeat protein